MRTVALLAILSLIWVSSLAQTTWLVAINGPAFVDAQSLSIDPDDKLLVVGNFDNGVTLGGTTYDGAGSFLIKLSKDGTPVWHRVVRYGAGETRVLRKVDTDASGNVYIAGNFPQVVTIDGHSYSSSFQYNGYVTKFNPQGELQWTKVLGNVQQFYDMKVNAVGQVLLYSMQNGVIGIDAFAFETGTNSVGVMLHSSGAFLWAKTLGSANTYTTWPRACAIDDAGNAYFHGIFSGTLTLDGHHVTGTVGNHNFFIAKMNPVGVCQWITAVDRKVMNETNNPPNGLLVERGALAVDGQGNIYMGGYSWTGIKVGSISLMEEGTCIIKFNATGQAVWAKLGDPISFRTIDNIVVDEGLMYVSGVRPGGLYFSVYATDGTYTRSGGVTRFPASVPAGLDVDSEHHVYLCGRIAYGANRLQGFVLNYGLPTYLPDPAGIITGPTSVCPSEDVSFTTSDIAYASSYLWEIYHEGTRLILETFVPELHFSLVDYLLINDFTIRVRGKNEVGTGSYSAEEIIEVEKPRPAPNLIVKCGDIAIENPEGITTLDWYFNDTIAAEYGRTSTSITPAKQGIYHVTIDDACGPVSSNQLAFVETEKAPTILVSCGEISVENPKEVTTVDWYFNGALAEEYGRLNTSITPDKEGTYYAAVDEGCGPMISIEVNFIAEEPKEPPALVVSCTEISIAEPQAGITLDWYFNDAIAEKYGRTSTSITPTDEGTYKVAIDDVCGPIFSGEVTFEFLNGADYEVPNVITPNGDAFNQRFVVDSRLESPGLVIYNRWGTEVYADEKYGNTWEGENLPSGVYYYQLDSKCLSAPIKGIVSIAR